MDTEYSFDADDEEDAILLPASLGRSFKAIPEGAPVTDTETLVTRDDISVSQWQARFAIGHRFKVSANNKLTLSLGYTLGSVNGFDTRDTNSDVEDEGFTQGSLGNRNAKLKPSGFDLTLGWNF